jgi:hypothetical protein
VLARTDHATRTYAEVLQKLDQILDGDIGDANPIDVSTMGYTGLSQLLSEERKLHDRMWSSTFLRNALEIIYAVLVFKYHFPAIFFDATRYAAAIDTHSDSRKFDDLLRMVVDCSPEQVEAIEALLEREYHRGEIFYGVHVASEALMTYFVYGMTDGEHIHFVDGGGGGGYAMAARGFKRQLKAAASIAQVA